ncbi:MAG: hypothetical protein V3W18_04405 [candidate division Zixibacteria bacterium]
MRIAKAVLGKAIFVLVAVCSISSGSVLAQDIELIYSGRFLGIYSIAIDGDYAFLSTTDDMVVLDISDRSNPDLLYAYELPCRAENMFIQDDFLYTSCGYSGMDIIDISNPSDIFIVSNLNVGHTDEVFVIGTTAYLATPDSGLYIVDVSQPEEPVVVGYYQNDDFDIYDVVVSGDYAYVAVNGPSYWFGMLILEITNPANPILRNTLQTTYRPVDFVLRDDLIYESYFFGFNIIDISDPIAPVILSDFPAENRFYALDVFRDLAYLCDGMRGLSVVNISDPYNPVLLANRETDESAVGVIQYGYYTFEVIESSYWEGYLNILWYTGIDSGAVSGVVTNEIGELLEDVAVSVIAAPMKDSTDTDGNYLLEGFYTGVYDISFSHSYYEYTVVTGVAIESGLITYRDVIMGYPPLADVGSSAILSPIDTVLEGAPYYPVMEITNFGYNPQSFDLVFEIYDSQTDDLLFADTTSAYDISEMTIDTITFAESFTFGHASTYNSVSYTVLPGDENASNDTATGVCHSYLVYPPVEQMSATDIPTHVIGVDVSGDYAYILAGGLRVFDVSDPENPIEVVYMDQLLCNVISIEGNYAYLLSNGLEVVDISDPTDPVVIGFCDVDRSGELFYSDLFVQGDYAYVSEWDLGLHIVDLTDRSNPTLVTTYQSQNNVTSAYVRDGYAYLSTGESGLEIVDVSNPANPLFVTSYDTPGVTYRTYVDDNYAYVADESSMQILDISNPFNPVFVSQYDAHIAIYRMLIQGPYAYLLDIDLAIVDVLSPENPVYTGGYSERSFYIWDHAVQGSYIYLGEDYLFRILRFPTSGSGCQYVVGDYNGNNTFNVADIISAFSKLKTGSPEASLLCECPLGSGDVWAVAVDLNNSCGFNIADVIAGFSKLKTGEPELIPCEACPPGGR